MDRVQRKPEKEREEKKRDGARRVHEGREQEER